MPLQPCGFTREDVRCFMTNDRRAAAAWEKGYYDKSVVPVTDINGLLLLDKDETIRPNTSVETLAKLNPSFAMPGKMGFEARVLDNITN